MTLFEENLFRLYKEKGRHWLAQLPTQVQKLAAEWHLTELTPFTNLSYNYVLLGLQRGEAIILKIGPDTAALAQEALALKAFASYNAAPLLQETAGALLLKRLLPGTTLKSLKNEQPKINAVQICCEVMAKLHTAPLVNAEKFPPISDWLKKIDQPWDMPPHLLEKARLLKQRLLKNAAAPVLLHGDLHHENILLDKAEWKVVDPKGVIGSPINEVWAFIMDIEQDVNTIAQRFNWSAMLVLEWYFVHLILAACWNLEDNLPADLFLKLAAQAYNLLQP